MKQPHHYISLIAGARADITWWRCLLHCWSGRSFFSPAPIAHHVYSDASGWGCGEGLLVPDAMASGVAGSGHLSEASHYSCSAVGSAVVY